jgi:hypothetical protein
MDGLNTQTEVWMDGQTDRHTHTHKVKWVLQTEGLTGRQAGRQTDRQVGRQASRQAGKQVGRQAVRQTYRQTDR